MKKFKVPNFGIRSLCIEYALRTHTWHSGALKCIQNI